MLQLADRAIDISTRALAWVGAVAVTGLLAVTAVQVLLRYGLNDPIFGSEDISTLLLLVLAGSSVAYGARHDAHVSVNLITQIFSPQVTRWTDVVIRLLTVAIVCLAAYALITKACGLQRACLTNNLNIEHRPFYYFLAASMALYAAHTLVDLLLSLAPEPE